MAWHRLLFLHSKTKTPTQNPPPISLKILASHFSTSFLKTKTPKKHKPKRPKKHSPRTSPIQKLYPSNPHFESLVHRDAHFHFLTKTKLFLQTQPQHVLLLDHAAKLHRQLGFPRGRKLLRSILRHPLLLETYRHSDNKIWFGFSELMEDLLQEEQRIWDEVERCRIDAVRKLLMMSVRKRIALNKLHHCRLLFGLPDDFRDRVFKYSDYFRVVVEENGRRVLELKKWDPALAISALEKEYLVDEDKVKRAFKFPVKHGKMLELEVEDEKKLNLLNTLPLVSPYSDGGSLDLWSLEAEKYRVGVIHEFLNLTLEKRASIHHIVEFKEEFSLTKHTYQMLLKQPRTFYLAGTEMNWAVFLKDGYGENGELIDKDPQVVFNEKLHKYADMKELEGST